VVAHLKSGVFMQEKIKYKNVPCWYEISFRNNPVGIAVRINQEISNIKNTFIFFPPLEKSQFQKFSQINDEDKFFGFNYSGIKRRTEEFLEIFFPIPSVGRIDLCTDCEGKGVSKDDTPCIYCRGSGKIIIRDEKLISEISASLSVLFSHIFSPQKETSSKVNQLLTLYVTYSNEIGGCGINGVLKKEFCSYLNWLSNNPKRKQAVINACLKAMKTVFSHCYIIEDESIYDNDFQITIKENTRFIISVPGNNCEIYSMGKTSNKKGDKLNCHNVDTPAQQLSLLAALCILHEKAREDMGHY
jgi:hypothetical protein